MFTCFLFFHISFCVCLCDFLHPCLSFSLALYLPLCLCLFFSLVLPLKTQDLTLKIFWLITPGIFSVFERSFLGSVLLLSGVMQERVTLIILVIGFAAVIYMRWHSVQTCRPSQPFFRGENNYRYCSPHCLSLFLCYTTPSLASSGYCLHTNRDDSLLKEWDLCMEVKL